MNKLLSANFLRLRKNKCFWGGLIYMAVAGMIYPFMRYIEMKNTEFIFYLEGGFTICALFTPIVLAIFCSLFVGREYSDGTIRNKIMIGHQRLDIYLTNLIVNIVVMFLFCLVYFIIYLCVGIPLLGFFHTNIQHVMMVVLTTYALCLAFSCLYTMIAMICTSKAISSILCIMSVLFLLLIGIYTNARLQEPEFYPSYNVSMDGVQEEKEEHNPNYLEGTTRDVYEFLFDFLPGGQVIQCASMQVKQPIMLILYSGIICLITSGVGLVLFKQKDLK